MIHPLYFEMFEAFGSGRWVLLPNVNFDAQSSYHQVVELKDISYIALVFKMTRQLPRMVIRRGDWLTHTQALWFKQTVGYHRFASKLRASQCEEVSQKPHELPGSLRPTNWVRWGTTTLRVKQWTFWSSFCSHFCPEKWGYLLSSQRTGN